METGARDYIIVYNKSQDKVIFISVKIYEVFLYNMTNKKVLCYAVYHVILSTTKSEGVENMAQNFTSAATAVNGKAGKLPAIYNKINLEGLCILDIGCGAEVAHIRKIARKTAQNGMALTLLTAPCAKTIMQVITTAKTQREESSYQKKRYHQRAGTY